MVLVSEVDHNVITVNKEEDIKCYFNKNLATDIEKDIKFISNENWYPLKERVINDSIEYMKKEFNITIDESHIHICPLIYIKPFAEWKVPVRIIIYETQEFNIMFQIYNAGIFENHIVIKRFL